MRDELKRDDKDREVLSAQALVSLVRETSMREKRNAFFIHSLMHLWRRKKRKEIYIWDTIFLTWYKRRRKSNIVKERIDICFKTRSEWRLLLRCIPCLLLCNICLLVSSFRTCLSKTSGKFHAVYAVVYFCFIWEKNVWKNDKDLALLLLRENQDKLRLKRSKNFSPSVQSPKNLDVISLCVYCTQCVFIDCTHHHHQLDILVHLWLQSLHQSIGIILLLLLLLLHKKHWLTHYSSCFFS